MFTVLDRISRPGHPDKPNEDICGVSGDWAWVIDTSIFPGTAPVMHDKSDAAWLARFANERLSNLAPQAEDGVTLLRHVMEEARTAYRAVAPKERHEDFVTWPLGAMTLVRRRGDTLDAWTFGDTTAYVRQPDGAVQVLGDAPGLREAEAAMAADLMRQAGSRPTAILDEPVFLAWLGGAPRAPAQKRRSGSPSQLQPGRRRPPAARDGALRGGNDDPSGLGRLFRARRSLQGHGCEGFDGGRAGLRPGAPGEAGAGDRDASGTRTGRSIRASSRATTPRQFC